MNSGLNERKIYEFADFRLIADEGLLLRNGEPVPLPPKVFGVLSLLVERNGHLVQKDEFIDRVWEGSFVEESVVTKAVSHARQVLDPTAKEKFIQTVSKRGYRFVFPVSVAINASGAFRVTDLAGVDEGPAATPESVSSSANAAAGPARLTDKNSTGNGTVELAPADASPPASHDRGDFEQPLPATSSSFRRLRGPAKFAGGIGVVLLFVGLASYIALSGRFIGRGDRSPDRGTKSDEAYRLYLLANNLMEQRGAGNVQRALEYVDKAVKLDPKFVRAWAAKAMFHLLDPALTPTERYQLSKESVEKALALDPNLSEANSVLCYFRIGYEFDFAAAETTCKRSIELDPNSAVAHRTYAQFLSTQGRFDESVAESRKAIDLEPHSYLNQMDYGLVLYYARRFEEEAQWKRLIDQHPNDSFNYRRLSKCMLRQGRESEAFDYLIKGLAMDGVDNETLARFKTAYATSGWRGVTLEQIRMAEAKGFPNPFGAACLFARLGDKDKAFEFLEKTHRERNDLINELKVEPQLDPLRDDPRYTELVRRVEGM